jgi:transcriptional regulator with XRE-family HTH domain
MERSELVSSREYWITEIQLQLFNLIEKYRKDNKLNKTQLAEKLGVTKGYITQVLNGDFDHKMSKLVDLSLAFGKVPIIHFVDLKQYLIDDANNKQDIYYQEFKPVKYYTVGITPSVENAKNTERFIYSSSLGKIEIGLSESPQPQSFDLCNS